MNAVLALMAAVKMQFALTHLVLTLVNVRMDILEMDSFVQVSYPLTSLFC